MITPKLMAGALIALAVTVGIARLLWQQRGREPRWGRVAILSGLSIAAAILLFLTLFPPATPFARGTWVVATAGAPSTLTAETGERLIALPEAPAVAAAERVPDLATALRRDGRPARLRIVGAGLTARDRAAATGIPIDFRPPPAPRGLIALEPPPATAAGSAFAVAGRANGLAGGSAELIDPTGRRVDARGIGTGGRFTLIGSARAPGMTLFTLRLRDTRRAIVGEAVVPLWTVHDPKPKVLMIGAPGPETKYLRRWATDAGIELTSRLAAGGGVELGDAPVALTATTLDRYDALIIDDRSWSGLGGGRAIVVGAVARGLGVIVRMTGPASATMRREWAALGLDVGDGQTSEPVALGAAAIDADALAAQRSPPLPDQAGGDAPLDDPAPDLGHWDVRFGSAIVPLVRDDEGNILAGWRQRGLGRTALWTIGDGYALVLAGQGERYFQWWSDTVSKVARAEPQFAPDLPALPRVGERMAICGVTGEPRVTGPDGRETRLAIADGQNCAAYWPAHAGLHLLVQPVRGGAASRPFHVYAAGDLPGVTATDLAEVTNALAAASQAASTDAGGGERPGPAWPWFLGWLAVSALLWWLERRRPG